MVPSPERWRVQPPSPRRRDRSLSPPSSRSTPRRIQRSACCWCCPCCRWDVTSPPLERLAGESTPLVLNSGTDVQDHFALAAAVAVFPQVHTLPSAERELSSAYRDRQRR